MRVPLHENGVEAALQEMTHARMAPVEALRVDAVQLAHPARERRLGGLEEEMVVVAHQHVGVEAPTVGPDDAREHGEELAPVGVVAEDRAALVAAGRDVPEGTCVLEAERAAHDRPYTT